MSEETKPHWYLVQARPRQAALAVEHLDRQGYCVFHPRLHVEQLRRGRPPTFALPPPVDPLFLNKP